MFSPRKSNQKTPVRDFSALKSRILAWLCIRTCRPRTAMADIYRSLLFFVLFFSAEKKRTKNKRHQQKSHVIQNVKSNQPHQVWLTSSKWDPSSAKQRCKEELKGSSTDVREKIQGELLAALLRERYIKKWWRKRCDRTSGGFGCKIGTPKKKTVF